MCVAISHLKYWKVISLSDRKTMLVEVKVNHEQNLSCSKILRFPKYVIMMSIERGFRALETAKPEIPRSYVKFLFRA